MTLLWMALLGCAGDEPAGDPVAGEAVYASACSGCHGDDGMLGVETGGVAAADLSTTVPALSDEALADVIQNGTGEMIATGLDDTETADVIAYLRETFP